MYDLESMKEELNRNESNVLIIQEGIQNLLNEKSDLNIRIKELRNLGEDPADLLTHLQTAVGNIAKFQEELNIIYKYNMDVQRMIAEIESINGNV